MSPSTTVSRRGGEIQDDIDYNKTLLKSLNPQTSDPQTRQQIEQEIQTLRDELRSTKVQAGWNHQGHALNNSAPANSSRRQNISGQQLSPHMSESNYRFPDSTGRMDRKSHFTSDGAALAQRDGPDLPPWDVAPTTDSRHSSGAFTGSSSAPTPGYEYISCDSSPALSTTNRKRTRESTSFQPAGPCKSLRATPSPVPTTRATTPSSLTSEFPDDPDLLKLLGGHPREYFREIREMEQEFAERKEQEHRDKELAQRLQEEHNHPSSGSATSRFGVPSLLSRATSQATLESSGRSCRPDTSHPNAFATSSSPLTFASLNPRRNDSSSRPPSDIKKETSFKTSSRQNEFPNFIDLGSDDDEESDYGSGVPSSELMEISPSEFPSRAPVNAFNEPTYYTYDSNPAGRGSWTDIDPTPPTALNPWSTQANSTPDTFQGYSTPDPYNANYYPHPSSTWSNVFGNVGQTLSNVATSAMNRAYGFIDDHYQGFPSNNFSGYSTLGSSANPQLVSDYEHYRRSLPNPNTLFPNRAFNNNMSENEAVQEYMERINNIHGDSRTSVAELKSLLENIRPDEQLPAHSRVGTPDAMSVTSPLYEHQKLGLTWLQQMEAGSNKGGILADDMGLGKTVQAIALMVTRRSQDPGRKSTLIVAPVALLKQWEREIQLRLKPAPECRLSTYIHHSRGIKTTWDTLRQHDVVLTTYGTLASEVSIA